MYLVAVASDQPVADVPDSLYIETAEIGTVMAAANAADAATWHRSRSSTGYARQSLTEDLVRGYYAAVRETMLASDLVLCGDRRTRSAYAQGRQSRSRVAQWVRQRDPQCLTPCRTTVAAAAPGQIDPARLRGRYSDHQRDLGVAIEAIAQLLEEYPDCRLVLFRDRDGARPFVDIEEFPALLTLADRIEWRSLRPLSELPEEMARFDINLAPLEFGNPYCEAKSELKFFEAALVDVPTIASPTGPFRRAIEHGKTGFLAAGTDDWYTYGKRLIEDPELRGRVGREAYNEVLARFGGTARRTQFGRVVAQLCGGIEAAHAFALDSQLAGKRCSRPAILPCETVLERDGLGKADVTVVIPLYNYDKYVVEALDSVREQTLAGSRSDRCRRLFHRPLPQRGHGLGQEERAAIQPHMRVEEPVQFRAGGVPKLRFRCG